ncbi:MAG TPA: hypothetical protein VI365_29085, partial [Trebonia sp.]
MTTAKGPVGASRTGGLGAGGQLPGTGVQQARLGVRIRRAGRRSRRPSRRAGVGGGGQRAAGGPLQGAASQRRPAARRRAPPPRATTAAAPSTPPTSTTPPTKDHNDLTGPIDHTSPTGLNDPGRVVRHHEKRPHEVLPDGRDGDPHSPGDVLVTTGIRT